MSRLANQHPAFALVVDYVCGCFAQIVIFDFGVRSFTRIVKTRKQETKFRYNEILFIFTVMRSSGGAESMFVIIHHLLSAEMTPSPTKT